MDLLLAFRYFPTFAIGRARRSMCAAAIALCAGLHSADAATIHLLTGNYPPFEYMENGEVKGLAVELLKEAFQRCHRDVAIDVLPWARALAETQQGRADAIFTAIKTPEREKALRFSSEPLVAMNSALYTRNDAGIRYRGDLSELAGYRLGMVIGTSHGAQFDMAVRAGILKYVDTANDTEPNLRKLLAGRIDIVAADRYVVTYYARANGWQDRLAELSPLLYSSFGYLAFSRNPALEPVRDEIDAALAAMKKDGSYQRILSRYEQ
jgi:polar amino acid transport system substrate-binding protein